MGRAYRQGFLRLKLGALAASLLAISTAAAADLVAPSPAPAPVASGAAGLSAFGSDTELKAFLRALREREPTRDYAGVPLYETAAPAAAPAAAVKDVVVTGARVSSAKPTSASPLSITNNQEADVDEGDIVKARGELLVILRRGKLFTVSTAGGGMRPVDSIDAYPPGVDAEGDWYDEMLVSGDQVAVIGYSYSRGGTQINRFKLDRAGRLTFQDAYQLRSNDYYSASNYASRLVGHRLVFYTPLYLGRGDDLLDAMPAVRRWTGQKGDEGFEPVADARHIYIAPGLRSDRHAEIDALHSVTSCDLTAPVMACSAIGVLGPSSRNFYVAGDAVYLWTQQPSWRRGREDEEAAMLYRLPLDGGRPSAIQARGAPTDQFSFREDREGRVLNVLLRSGGGGDAMWRRRFAEGDVALLRVPLWQFGDGSRQADSAAYRRLPRPRSDRGDFQNRFVGGYVLYGQGHGWGQASDESSPLVVAPVDGGRVAELRLGHATDRIEVLGEDAVVVGEAGADLNFTAIDLRAAPVIGDRYVLRTASQGETRSHGFFFRPDADAEDGASGVLGLPVARPARPGYAQLFDNSAAIVFLRRKDRRFSSLGELTAAAEGAVDDHCVASCVDWYGNARPIFLGRRVFALLGYELVEGQPAERSVREVGRVSFAPPRTIARR